MFKKSSYIIFILGFIGSVVFISLRSQIDINANAPIQKSSSEIVKNIQKLAIGLGFSMDSLTIASTFEQHGNYLKMIEDSLSSYITPAELNEKEAHLQSWFSVIAEKGSVNDMIVNTNMAFESAGKLGLRFSNFGTLIRLTSNANQTNPTFIQGDSLEDAAFSVVNNIFGYNLSNYEAIESQLNDSLIITSEGQSQNNILSKDAETNSPLITFEWRKNPLVNEGPELLSLTLQPVVKEFQNGNGFSTKFGYSIRTFTARNEIEPVDLNASFSKDIPIFSYVAIVLAIVLAMLIISIGISNIFKGKVEWRRSLLMFTLITAAIFGWRIIYYWDVYGNILSGQAQFIITLNNLLFGLVVGLYATMAYICWESFARNQKNGELDLVDAIWQRKIFVKETGSSLIHGFFIGGILLGLFALGVYLSDTFYLQSDSQFGFSEGSISLKMLTINMTAWSTVWLIGFGQIGFVYSFCKHWIKNNKAFIVVAFIITGLLLTVLGRLIATPLSIWNDFAIYTSLAIVIVSVYHKFGIVTSNTAWWVFVSVLLMMPYIGSGNVEMASTWWVQGILIFGIPLYGFISYKYGVPVSEIGDYIPEYQERITQHLRVEKEIEIARESQYKLMPVQPPTGDGFDVYGFFLPSFEVGGDYFDYVLSKDEAGTPSALTMVVVDVSGKAMRAAMPAIFTSGLLLSRMKEDNPDIILTNVNEPIFSRTDKRTFITCAMARYDLKSKEISVVNAGHCKPVLKRNGIAEFIQTPDPRFPLGFRANTVYNAQNLKLKKGDVFLLYSDGLPEAVNDKDERFGFDEVPRLLERIDTENLSSNEIAQEIKRTVQKFSNYQLADDTTVICLKV